MSYLDLPRIHLAGNFFANPSTINNIDSNFDPAVPLQPSWNPQGQALWKLDVTVQTALTDAGAVDDGADAVLGARLTALPAPNFAKLVDLDPDMQTVSQVYGLTVQMTAAAVPGATPAVLFTGTVDPCALTDLWMLRVVGSPNRLGDAGASGAYQSVVRVTSWGDLSGSPLLQSLHAASGDLLSIKWVVDGFNGNFQSPGFGWGRMVATLGPATAEEPAHFIPGRRLDVPEDAPANPNNGMPMTELWFGQAQVKQRTAGPALVLDLGNSVAVQTVPGGPPVAFPSPIRVYAGTTPLGTVSYTLDAYQRFAGIFELPLDAAQAAAVATQPLNLEATATMSGWSTRLQEREDGRLLNVDLSWMRLDPGVAQTQTLYAYRWGQADPGASVTLVPMAGQLPTAAFAVGVSSTTPPLPPVGGQSVTFAVGADGTATLQLLGGDTAGVRPYIDGQVYFLSPDIWSPWLSGGALNPMISALVFGPFPATGAGPLPAVPTWNDVGPILTEFARIYPGMRSILDMSDYDTVVANQAAMIRVFSLPVEHPNYMPVTRDLSTAKRDALLAWLNAGCPRGTPVTLTAGAAKTPATAQALAASSAATPAPQAED